MNPGQSHDRMFSKLYKRSESGAKERPYEGDSRTDAY